MKKRKEPNPFPYDESNPHHWSHLIKQNQEEYNRKRYYIWVMKDSRLAVVPEDWDLINEYINKCTLIENWCERNEIAIKEHKDRDSATFIYYTKDEEIEYVSQRFEFIPPSKDLINEIYKQIIKPIITYSDEHWNMLMRHWSETVNLFKNDGTIHDSVLMKIIRKSEKEFASIIENRRQLGMGLTEEMINLIPFKGVSENQENVSNDKKGKSVKLIKPKRLRKTDAINLLKLLEDDSYPRRVKDEAMISHPSFKRYRSEYIKNLVGDTFNTAFEILRDEGTLTYERFFEISKPPSNWYQKKFIESFFFHCSNPRYGKFNERCGGLKIEKNKEQRIKGQIKICFIL